MSKDFNLFSKSMGINTNTLFDYNKKFYHESFIANEEGVSVFNKMFDERVLFLSTEVEPFICSILKAQLLYLDYQSHDDITIYIDTPGGDIYSGLGLLDTMEFVNSDIITVNTGLAASMGAILLCSGTKGKRKSLKRARTMIHQPMSSTGIDHISQASDLEIQSREINSLKKELYEIISNNTGNDYDKILRDADRDYWMDAKSALEYGLIDEILLENK